MSITLKKPEMAHLLIASSDLPEVNKLLGRLQAKAKAEGVPMTWTASKPYPYYLSEQDIIEVVDLRLSRSIICAPGWTVLAHIQAEPGGNVVTNLSGGRTPSEWHKLDCHCDHCGTNRRRKVIYLVKKYQNREIRQVGKTCLKEYTGIDPYFAVKFADILAYADKLENPGMSWETSAPYVRLYNVRKIMALAVDAVGQYGYTPTSQPGSTSDRVKNTISRRDEEISPKNREEADRIIEWIKSSDFSGNDFMQNAKILVESEYIKYKDVGRICYLPVSYKKWMERQEQERQKREKLEKDKKAGTTSQFLGKVKERLTLVVKSVEKVTSCYNEWGMSTLYRMIDNNSNILTTWTSGDPFGCWEEDNNGSLDHLTYPLAIKGTVKEHKEYKGENQTVLTRVKMI